MRRAPSIATTVVIPGIVQVAMAVPARPTGSATPLGAELIVLSLYEADGGLAASGTVTVDIQRNADIVLVMAPTSRSNGRKPTSGGANVQEILLNGYHSQTVTGAGSIPTSTRSYDQTGTNFGASCGWLAVRGGGCDTNQLITGVQFHTGLTTTELQAATTARRSPSGSPRGPGPTADVRGPGRRGRPARREGAVGWVLRASLNIFGMRLRLRAGGPCGARRGGCTRRQRAGVAADQVLSVGCHQRIGVREAVSVGLSVRVKPLAVPHPGWNR